MTRTVLRFAQLRERNIVRNRMQLSHLIEKEGFPPGFMLSPNARAWHETDIEDWLKSRPSALDRAAKVRPRGFVKHRLEATEV
jgi:hypothetical protein